jgi:GNAT superfamily N-acetyltransferase
VIVKCVPYEDPLAVALRADLLADLAARYDGDGDGTPIAAGEFDPPRGAFLVAWLDGEPAGCVGWRSRRPDGEAELKRMWVALHARRRGVAKALLAAVEDSARAAGRTRMVLETGVAQPEAMALYAASGYALIPNFGHYADSPLSRSYARDL